MRTRAVWIAVAAGVLLAGCTEDPDGETAEEPTAEVSVPAEVTETGTGDPTVTLDTASPTDTASPPGTATDTGTGQAAAPTECEAAVEEAGGLTDLREAEQRLRPVFDACVSVDEFSAAVESRLEGFEDLDPRPYAENACTLLRDLAETPLCRSL